MPMRKCPNLKYILYSHSFSLSDFFLIQARVRARARTHTQRAGAAKSWAETQYFK